MLKKDREEDKKGIYLKCFSFQSFKLKWSKNRNNGINLMFLKKKKLFMNFICIIIIFLNFVLTTTCQLQFQASVIRGE